MKSKLLWVSLIVGCLNSCNENIDLCLERKPIPVIYSVFKKNDSINYVYVTKTWSGDNGGSLETAKNPDSIYFKNVTVKLDLIRNYDSISQSGPDTIQVVPDLEMVHDKKPGYFIYPNCPAFALHRNLEDIDIVIININIPGYDKITLTYVMPPIPIFTLPNHEGTGISILPDQGLNVKFNALGRRTDLNFCFEVLTKSETGIRTDTIVYQIFSAYSPEKMSYGNFKSALNLQLKDLPGVEYRKFGKVRFEIWTGIWSLTNYHTINQSYIDFTLPGSPWVPNFFWNGGAVSQNQLDNLTIDDYTRELIARDTSLSKYKFVKW